MEHKVVESIQRGIQQADELAQPWQQALGLGYHFYYLAEGIPTYGEIVESDPDRADYYATEGHNLWPTHCYSELCPDGEYDDTHVACMSTPINRTVFELAQKMGWPNLVEVVSTMLGLTPLEEVRIMAKLVDLPLFPVDLAVRLSTLYGIESPESFYDHAALEPALLERGLDLTPAEVKELADYVREYLPKGYTQRAPIRRPRGVLLENKK